MNEVLLGPSEQRDRTATSTSGISSGDANPPKRRIFEHPGNFLTPILFARGLPEYLVEFKPVD